MAIRANVSFSQKLGQPDYGSVGARLTEAKRNRSVMGLNSREVTVMLLALKCVCNG